jgi:hypothetical protein
MDRARRMDCGVFGSEMKILNNFIMRNILAAERKLFNKEKKKV